MDNPEILFYIVFGLIYFLTRKKKKKVVPPGTKTVAPPSQQNDEKAPPLSFDSLLKELTGQGRQQAEEKPKEPEPQDAFVIEEEETPETPSKEVDWTKDHMQETLTSSFDDEAIKKRYEEATSDQSLDTIGNIEDEETSSDRLEAYKIIKEEQSVAADIKKILSDPDDIKNAVILSEVLKRRF